VFGIGCAEEEEAVLSSNIPRSSMSKTQNVTILCLFTITGTHNHNAPVLKEFFSEKKPFVWASAPCVLLGVGGGGGKRTACQLACKRAAKNGRYL
jgi:hypothetical protein